MLDANVLGVDPQRLLDSVPQGVYVTDRNRRIVYWSKSAQRITGWAADEIVGRCCFDNTLCHVDKDGRQLCGEEFCPMHRSIVTGLSSTVPIIVFARHRDGHRVPMRVSVAPIQGPTGEITGGIEVFQDLTNEFADMRRGRRIQATSMVNDAARDPRVSVQVHYVPHDIIGGDFYAISRIDDGRYGFILADVSGHGLSAALYTMHLASLWDDHRRLIGRPGEYAHMVHTRLQQLLHDEGSFATAMCGVINVLTREIALASAGGPLPLRYERDGTHSVLDVTGSPLGMYGDAEFNETQTMLAPGSRLLLFTDGLTEISGKEGEQLGEEGLASLLQQMDYPRTAISFSDLETRLLTLSDRIRFDDDLTIIEIAFAEA